ncbi:hypothetical protein BDR07DRAFT_1481418 [Suillus spraguei]|nr:hypothetical protein BDR07DRAFT_1481418 [Suillus spraguei]
MPLRSTKDRVKAKKNTTKEEVGNEALPDSRQKFCTASLDNNVKEDAKRDKSANKALLGLSFGHWNSRPLMQNQVQSLYQSFIINGVDRFNPIHALPLVLPKDWIVDGTVEKGHEKKEELPILRISDKAPKDWKIKAAGGRHRTEAIKKWVLKMQRDVDALEVEEQRIIKRAPEEVEAEINDIDNAVNKRLHKLREVLEYHGQWIVTVFDANQVDTLVGIHISRNETKHIYMQSPEEGLIQRTHPMAKGPAAKQTELLSQDYVFDHLKILISSGTHYIYSPEMQLNRFHKVMLSSYGGLIAYATARLENRLRWCFNTVSYTLDEHQKIEVKSKNSASFQKLKIKKEEIFENLKQATPVLKAISDPLRDKLDRIFNTHLGDNTPASYRFGNDQDEMWLTAFKEYSYAVVAAMNEYASEVLSADETKDLDDDVRAALLGCAGKAALVLDVSSQAGYCSFPFMSHSVITTLVRNMSMIEGSIFEDSILTGLLVVLSDAVYGKGTWQGLGAWVGKCRHDTSNHGTPNFDPVCRADAVVEIHHSFFLMFAEYINMERQLAKINMPQRVTNQQQLMTAFGLGDASKGTKGKKRKRVTKAHQDRKQEDDWENSSPQLSSEESSDVDDSEEDNESNDERVEHRTLARKTERRRKEDLRLEALEAQKILSGGTKSITSTTREIYQPWTRQSKFSSDTTTDAFRGMKLIQFHTFEWSIKSGASRARAMRIMACMAIAEQAVINAYRPELLGDLEGGAAAIRFALEENTASYRVTFRGGKRQMTLTNIKVSSLRPINFTWPDGLEVDRHALIKVDRSFDLALELAAHKRDVMCFGQSHQLQAIVDAVQKSPIAWEDATGAFNGQERPRVRPEVQCALENLAKFLNANAYLQRQSSKSKKQTLKNEVPSSESLSVAYWHSGMEKANDVSVTKNLKFIILSSEEDERHLVEKARVHECKQRLLVDRAEKSGKEAMEKDESINRGNNNSYQTPSPLLILAPDSTTQQLALHNTTVGVGAGAGMVGGGSIELISPLGDIDTVYQPFIMGDGDGGACDSHDMAAKKEDLDDAANKGRCSDEVVGEGRDNREHEDECNDREHGDNQETNKGGNHYGPEGCIDIPLHSPNKPDSPISVDLNGEEGKQSDVIGLWGLPDIPIDAPSCLPPTQLPTCSLHGYDIGFSDDLGPQAATSDFKLKKNICVALNAPNLCTTVSSAIVKKTQKRGHSSSTSSNESHYGRPSKSQHQIRITSHPTTTCGVADSSYEPRRKRRQLGDTGFSGNTKLGQFQETDDITSQLG